MSLSQIIDHAAQAVARLAAQFGESTYLRGLISAVGDEVQTLENALYELLVTRDVDTATDMTLANLGRLVGAPPQGPRSTAEFRARIKTQILANRSTGNPADIYAISKEVIADWDVAGQPKITEQTIATYEIGATPQGFVTNDTEAAKDLARILNDSSSAGVHSIVISQAQAPGFTFCFDGGVGLGFGDGGFIGAYDGNQ